MAEKFYKQNYWSEGLSENELIGGNGYFSKSFGVDIHETPGVIKSSFYPVKDTGALVIDQLCKFAVGASSGTSYWFGNNGTIFKRMLDVVGNVSWGTVWQSTGSVINGAGEYNGYIYWTILGNVNRIPVNGNWISDTQINWGSINSFPTYHPMVDMGTHLLIGNGTTISSVNDTGTLTVGGLPNLTINYLPSNYSINALCRYGIDILVGTKISGGINEAKLLRWDLASPTWIQDINVPETNINCFLVNNNGTFFQAGNKGKIYEYDGASIHSFKRIPRNDLIQGPEDTLTYPQSSANYNGIGYFGVSNTGVQSMPLPGLYSFGRKNEKYPVSLSHQYPISDRTITQMHIGSIISGVNSINQPYIIFSWKNNSTGSCGIDSVYNNLSRLNGAYIETQSITGNTFSQKTFGNHIISYKAKPANTSIDLEYYSNYSSGTTGAINLNDKSSYNNLVSNDKIESGALKYKIILKSVDGVNTPEVYSIYSDFNEKDVF
jgi:hypothetical protein